MKKLQLDEVDSDSVEILTLGSMQSIIELHPRALEALLMVSAFDRQSNFMSARSAGGQPNFSLLV